MSTPEKPVFSGLWLPKQLFEKGLSPTEMLVFAEIDALGGGEGCYASQAYLYKTLGLPRRTFQRALTVLLDKKLITQVDVKKKIPVYKVTLHYQEDRRQNDQQQPEDRRQNDADIPESAPKRRTEYSTRIKPKTTSLVPADAGSNGSGLHCQIRKAFEAKHGPFSNYGKEGKAINRLIEKATQFFPADPKSFLANLGAEFWRLKSSPEKFWHEQPFTPSALDALFDRVAEHLRSPPAEKVIDKSGLKGVRL